MGWDGKGRKGKGRECIVGCLRNTIAKVPSLSAGADCAMLVGG